MTNPGNSGQRGGGCNNFNCNDFKNDSVGEHNYDINDAKTDNRVFDKLSIISANVRGFTSKRSSIQQGIESLMPDIALYQETMLQGRRQPRFRGYTTVMQNRSSGKGGGVLSLIDNRLKTKTCVTALGDDDCEMTVLRLDLVSPAITIINHYGPIERCVEETEKSWEKILLELAKAEARGDQVILVGDLNKHLGKTTNVGDKLSFGGKLVNQLLDEGRYCLVNTLPNICTGGLYTRQDPADPEKKSVLTLAIASKSLIPFIDAFRVDSERKYSPRRILKRKNGNHVVRHSDHFLVELVLKNLPNIPKVKKSLNWFYNKPGGWDRFYELTKGAAKDIEKMLKNCKDLSVDEIDKKITKRIEKVKWKAFGKRLSKESGGHFMEGNRSRLNEANLIRADLNHFQDVLHEMRKKGPRLGQIWQLRKILYGGKAETQIPAAVIDPDSGELRVSVEDIKDATTRHIINTLKDGIPKDGWEDVVEKRELFHLKCMQEEPAERIKIQKQAFEVVRKKMIQGNKRVYQDVTNASQELHEAYFKFFCILTEREEIPKSFSNTELTQLYKQRGNPTSLNSWRFIHVKGPHVRLFEAALTELCKPFILETVSPMQIGGIEGQRPEQHLLTMKTFLRTREVKRLPTWISLFDLEKFFDRQSAVDSCAALHGAGVRGPLYRLIYKICAVNTLRAKTPVGMTKPFTIGAVVAQGSSLGALQSALNLDRAVWKAFTAILNLTMNELGMPARPFIFQDDLMKLSANREECQLSHDLIYETMCSKTLDLNVSKCRVLISGKSAEAKKLRSVYEEYPIKTGGEITLTEESSKYLGDELHFNGCRGSWAASVAKREGKLRGAVAEIMGLVRDFSCNTLGPLRAGLDLWESLALPALLHNCGSWLHITATDFITLERVQTNFLKKLMKCPRSTSGAMLRFDCGLPSLKFRIMKEKILLRDHILHADPSCLAQVISLASDETEPGFRNEVETFMAKHMIRSRESDESQSRYKKFVKKTINSISAEEDLQEISARSKTRYLAGSKAGRQSYLTDFTLHSARLIFAARAGVVDVLKGNNYRIPASERECVLCQTGAEETCDHYRFTCPTLRDLRSEYKNSLTNPANIFDYWRRALDLRHKAVVRAAAVRPAQAPD